MNIGQRIKYCRKQKKITQKQLAEMVGKSYSVIQKYEIGIVQPPMDMLMKIADALSISIYDLVKDIELPAPDPEEELRNIGSAINLRLYRERLLSAFNTLNPYGKKIAAQRIEELAEIEKYSKPFENTPPE